MKVIVLTLFPNEVGVLFQRGVLKRAIDADRFQFEVVDLRQFGSAPHYKVDDIPFGGGVGMVLRADIMANAIRSIEHYENYRILYTCPKGPRFNQGFATELSNESGIILISGYYEGLDERVFELFPIERVSIGDFVVSSGDLPALMIAEAVVRLLPGVLGNPNSVQQDSYLTGLLEHPQYTQPRSIDESRVPDVLTSGHHQNIKNWQLTQSFKETLIRKPSLLANLNLNSTEQKILIDVIVKGD